MTRDEIFSSELEYLYFRLVAARNALNETRDPDTEHCLYEILTQTLDKIDRKGSEEDRAAASEIVVRKSNKYARYILTNQKIVLFSTIAAVLIGIGAVLAIIMILLGSEDKLTPSLLVGGIGAILVIAIVVVIKYKKGKMEIAREHLKGKTVIGARINTCTVKDAEESDNDRSSRSYSSSPKVVHNFKGVLITAIIIVAALIVVFVVKNKGEEIKVGAMNMMSKIGLNPDKPEYSHDNWVAINDSLQEAHDRICYSEANKLIKEKNYVEADKYLSMIPLTSSYKDTETIKKDVKNHIKYEEASELSKTSLADSLAKLFELPKDFLDVEELINKYLLYTNCKGVYENNGKKFVIKDFKDENGKIYLISEDGEMVVSQSTRPDALFRAKESSGGNDIMWYISETSVLRIQDTSELKYIKK